MAKYRYAGPGPHIDDEGAITRPGDEREFDGEPDWGPWELLDVPPAPEPLAPAPAAAPFTPPTPTAEGM